MTLLTFTTSKAVAAAVILFSIIIMYQKNRKPKRHHLAATEKSYPIISFEQLPGYIRQMVERLTDVVILRSDSVGFLQALESNWAQQNREVVPACIVRPRNTQQLGTALAILSHEHALRRQSGHSDSGIFTIRSGGTNPCVGATMKDAVMIDLSHFCEVTPAADGTTAIVGAGARWHDVYKVLHERGLTAIGGRSSPVGVAGLALQGGISFYSPKYGFVCSNIVSYEVVLASGDVVTASASENSRLWQALKGGSSNFGIVTRFTLRCIPSSPLWVSQTFAPAVLQHGKALELYQDYVQQVGSPASGVFDDTAAGPIMSFVYVQKVGFQLIALNLVYIRAPERREWPRIWEAAGFKKLWAFYRSSSVMSHKDAVDQIGRTATAGARQLLDSTTIHNDLATMKAAYSIFCDTLKDLRKVKGLVFPFTFQAILPEWMNKGDPNVLGLQDCTSPLVIIGCLVTWTKPEDDRLVKSTVRTMLERINATAGARGSSHPYRFTNYCMEWQQPYWGCPEATMELMQETSHKYDPSGLFQTGLAGGFKLSFGS